MTIYRNSTHAFIKEGAHILNSGRTVLPRGKKTLERLNTTVTLAMPKERCFVLKHRNNNIFAQIAETLWMIAGRDDIEWLSYYLPRAPQFSDNGRTWRGAYGPRLRNWNGASDRIDQLWYAIEAFKADPLTRQAVVSIWDASIDTKPGKDIPCNNWLHFIQREGRLMMNVSQRSSDILWGYSGIDTFSWSVLHEMMAHWTGFEMGSFTHFITSFHIYAEYESRLAKIISAWSDVGNTIYQYDVRPAAFSTPLDVMDRQLSHIFAIEGMARLGKVIDLWSEICAMSDDFLRACTQMLYIYTQIERQESKEVVMAYVNQLPADLDFRFAALEYLHRAMKWDIRDLVSSDERWILAKFVEAYP